MSVADFPETGKKNVLKYNKLMKLLSNTLRASKLNPVTVFKNKYFNRSLRKQKSIIYMQTNFTTKDKKIKINLLLFVSSLQMFGRE